MSFIRVTSVVDGTAGLINIDKITAIYPSRSAPTKRASISFVWGGADFEIQETFEQLEQTLGLRVKQEAK